MYPVLFRVGGVDITTFGVMVGVASLVGLWLFRRELRAANLSKAGGDAAVWGLFGGLVGAKLLWAAEYAGEAPLFSLLLARGGLSWFGGFAGGVGVGIA